MRQYDSQNLVVHPGNSHDPDVVVEVTPELAGWEYISFQLRRLPAKRSWASATADHEMAIVILSGRLSVESARGKWSHIGERDSVFRGLPYALYLAEFRPPFDSAPRGASTVMPKPRGPKRSRPSEQRSRRSHNDRLPTSFPNPRSSRSNEPSGEPPGRTLFPPQSGFRWER